MNDPFWLRVDLRPTPDGCWLWTGPPTSGGYGQLMRNGRHCKAHRVAYELAVGPIPDGLTIDHVAARGCTSRLCCNPAHLEPVTRSENSRRATAGRFTGECAQGHPFDLYRGGRWICRRCERDRSARYQARKRMVAA